MEYPAGRFLSEVGVQTLRAVSVVSDGRWAHHAKRFFPAGVFSKMES